MFAIRFSQELIINQRLRIEYMSKLIKHLMVLVLATTLVACGGGGGGSSSSNACSDLNLKVFGGDQCNFERSPVVAIVGFSAGGLPISNCSATMVTVNDALTAAHCAQVAASPGGDFRSQPPLLM